MNQLIRKSWVAGLMVLMTAFSSGASELSRVDYEAFLGQHDMLWDRIPNRWEVAPYTGNGNVGFLFYQAQGEAKNMISIYAGRHDYYDHRLDEAGDLSWIYRCRLPLGHFNLESTGNIQSVDLRLGLWNAEMTGTVKTSTGSYAVRGFSHSTTDVIYFETVANDGESIQITWHPDVPFSSVRKTLDAGGGPKASSWDSKRTAPYELPPEPTWSKDGGMQFCEQMLFQERGETTTGWEITGDADGKQLLLASIHHSFPEHNSLQIVKANLTDAREQLDEETFISSHQTWWHDYYPLSFLTINDAEKEAFYWIQMYKLGSAMRENGPILDLMGPWYNKTFWPMVWGDLNVELQYWTPLTANRLSLGNSLPDNLDKYADNLAKNVPERWKDSAAIGACFPQDCEAYDNAKVPDMLCWILHNYWLQCEFAGDRERMRDGLFPLLKKNVNGYLNFIRERPVKSDDGKIHISLSWSPEYPGGQGQDMNFTIGLLRWACQTLLDINEEHQLNDPLASEWQNLLDHLVEFQIDENGMRIGKDIPFDKPHRHYSHLLAFYPLAVLTPDTKENADLLRTSLDHWLDVSINSGIKVGAMPVTGYTATGAASMYAMLGDAEKAYTYLDFLIKHKNVSSTTMYAEGNPVIESPLSFATAIHDMLLQSWGPPSRKGSGEAGVLRVFRGAPKKWADVAFKDLRTQGAFLVSAKKKGGVTQFVSVKSLVGSPCRVQTDIPDPNLFIDGVPAKAKRGADGVFEVDLKKGETVLFTPVALEQTDRSIAPIPVSESDRNLFGLNDKTTRLPGHAFYYTDSPKRGRPAASVKPVVKNSLSSGRIVRIELPGEERVLSLAEVEVFSGGINVAENQKASASSEVFGGIAALAVDGNTDGDYKNGSVTHTAKSINPWWEVDLGRAVNIEKIVVHNRSGSLGAKLDGFTLQILDENRTVVFSKESCIQAPEISFLQPDMKSSAGGDPKKEAVALKSVFAGASPDRPNVIFIKTDDQRRDSLSMTGHPVTKTPNIDQLAKEGVFFENAFITSPICGPSRANFFTGQWERKNRQGFHYVSHNHITYDVFDNSWILQLKKAGYFTGYIGKNHATIGPANEHHRYMKENIDFCYMKSGHLGFDLLKHAEFQNLKVGSQIEGLFEATEAFMRPGKDKEYFFENAHESVADFLHKRDLGKPFALSLNVNLPHASSIGGMGANPKDPEMYRTLYNDVQDDFVFPDGYPNIQVPLPDNVFRQDELMGYYKTTNPGALLDKKTKMARAVTAIDMMLGKLRAELEEMGIADNTIIVFASDHGLLLGEHGLGGKTFLYEESIRIPMIFYSPFFSKEERGTTVDELVVGQDLPATILDLCGLPVPETYQGRSMVPLIEGRPVEWRKEVFCENLFTDQGYPRMEAVRGTEWKYIRYFSKEKDRSQYLPDASINGEQPIYEELFNIKDDPKEQSNLAGNPEYAKILEAYRTRCQELVTELAR
jgi:arylsulfatase A-like enzyme